MMQESTLKIGFRWLYRSLPWLYFAAAVLVFVMGAFFFAVGSELGRAITAGESPFFEWVRSHLPILLAAGFGCLVVISVLQYLGLRAGQTSGRPGVGMMSGLQAAAMAAAAVGAAAGFDRLVFSAGYGLLAVLLVQGILALQSAAKPSPDALVCRAGQPESRPGLFLGLVFVMGGLPAVADPAWHRLQNHIWLDAGVDRLLGRLLPPLLSGAVTMGFAILTLALLAASGALIKKLRLKPPLTVTAFFAPFFLLSGLYAIIVLAALVPAVAWQVSKLDLMGLMPALFFLLTVIGGALAGRLFMKVSDPKAGLWRPALVLLLSLLAGTAVIYGNFFNPWFTALSYFKGALLKIAVIVAAAALVLIAGRILPLPGKPVSAGVRLWLTMAAALVLAAVPFGVLTRYPEVKAAILQFNEFCRVDAAFARQAVDATGLQRWIALGQDPAPNGRSHPWSRPWVFKKTHRSLLPAGFNLLVIVVDALRGDAFSSAGYRRDLTPFLDRWARTEAVSFRRAYSQGGGSFAAFPFLVAGRSRFELYGPELYRQNLYFKIAQAEKIRNCLVMKGFGPRYIFPPDYPVIELEIPEAAGDRRSATADEVFASTRRAIEALGANERFLAFLHLMDVHNDLWKKPGGIDFGDQPRDLYDNNLSYLDRAFERFVRWLRQAGIYDRTVIVFTSDHGEQFWEHGASLHGHTLYEEEIRVPLILRIPGVHRRFDDVPVIVADMAPTIAGLAGYTVDPPYDDPRMGISLIPLLLENRRHPYLNRDVAGRASFKRRYFLYRNWRWKLVYFAELDVLQLFDVLRDPQEKNNLLNELPDLAARMQNDLFDYLEKTEGKTYRRLALKNDDH